MYIYSQNQNLSELQKYEYKNEAEIQNLLFLHPEIVLELREEIPEFQFSMNIPSLVCRESPLSGCGCVDLMIITEDAVGTERLTLAGQMNCFIEVAKNIVELLQANLKVKDFVAIEYEEEKPSVLLEVIPSFGRNLNNETGYFGLLCSFTNTSNKTVRIVWNQSSLNYNGGSYSPFLSEQKFLNAAIPMAPSVITPDGNIIKEVFSATQPKYQTGTDSGWIMIPIKSTEVQIVLCIHTDSGEEYINSTIKVEGYRK